mgnify:FL=1
MSRPRKNAGTQLTATIEYRGCCGDILIPISIYSPRIGTPGKKARHKNNRQSKRNDGRGGVDMEREQTTIRIPADLKEKLQKEAEKKGYTTKDLIVFILWEYFQTNFPK